MIRLTRLNPAENMARFYLMDLRPALFGWSVVYEWGRIGRAGQVKLDFFDTPADAEAAMSRKLREKERRGYCRHAVT